MVKGQRQTPVVNLQHKIPIPISKIRSAVRRTIREIPRISAFTFDLSPLSLVFVGERRMRRLNKEYLGHDDVTDVITFNYGDTILNSRELSIMSPEIVICPAVAARNAKRYGNTLERELILYVVHGILHLCGYDDRSPEDVKRMRKKETEILKRIV